MRCRRRSPVLVQPKPKRMRVTFEAPRPAGVTPKDMILHLIGRRSAPPGARAMPSRTPGSAIRDMEVERPGHGVQPQI